MFNVRWEVRTGSQGRLSIEPTDSEMTLLKGQVQFLFNVRGTAFHLPAQPASW